MRKTLMLSAAALGLAIGAPAFAQTAATATQAPPAMSGTAADTGSATGSAMGSATGSGGAMQTQHWNHANHARMHSGMQAQNGSVRPGHVPGVGDSELASNRASNIDRADTRSVIAPRLPVPATSANASPEQLLGVAQQALRRGRTGEAQEALERAETRALDRSTMAGNESQPAQGPFVQAIGEARRSLANHDMAGAERGINSAMSASTYAQNGSAGSGGMSGGTTAPGSMSSGGMSGAGMSGGTMGAVGAAPAAGNGAYSGAAMAPGTNALATTGATNGNAIGATTGGPSQANGIPGTPNGISGQTGANSGGGGGAGSGSGGGGTGGGNGGSSR